MVPISWLCLNNLISLVELNRRAEARRRRQEGPCRDSTHLGDASAQPYKLLDAGQRRQGHAATARMVMMRGLTPPAGGPAEGASGMVKASMPLLIDYRPASSEERIRMEGTERIPDMCD